MLIENESIISRIDELLSKESLSTNDPTTTHEIYSGTITLMELVYGENSPQLKALSIGDQKLDWYTKLYMAIGVLKSLKGEINRNLVPSLERRITGEFFGDFINMAKNAIENNYKDVAAVLASAAIEDALKKFGTINGLELENKEMSEVINALKLKEVLKGPQAKISSSYITLRNKAFHAEWDKIDTLEVKSLIAFTEEFILVNFS
ncbi:MAG: hypothetical protein ABSA46_21010 [Thermodesulfovibrionales bacterium]|jgi:hypothetical protein